MRELPVIDISPLVDADEEGQGSEVIADVSAAIDTACRDHGFFLVTGHGVDAELEARLDRAAREFFARPEDEKRQVEMARAGAHWRGWFPVGGELTSGTPDLKEGYYFGRELALDDPRVVAGTPLHGPNLFPVEPAGLRPAVLGWMDAMERLGRLLMVAICTGLGLDPDHIERHLTAEPTVLFRIFHYPPRSESDPHPGWGVAEHTDYGLLTILRQDATGGLEVHTPAGWVDAPPVPGSLVCNLGDMLERLTGGVYRSTPHRVRPPGGTGPIGRLSFPFFFDPSWDARLEPLPVEGDGASGDRRERWDGADPLAFDGTYGEYLTAKVAKVFPHLGLGGDP